MERLTSSPCLVDKRGMKVSLETFSSPVSWFLLVRNGVFVALLLLVGCSSLTKQRHEQEAIEAELRQQERHIIELKAELDRKQGLLHAQDMELERLQLSHITGKQQGESQMPASAIQEISLGRLTGGYRINIKQPFDDALLVNMTPKDVDGHAVKLPGSMRIEVFEVSPQGLKAPLCYWEMSHRELRRVWEQPLVGTASYRLVLPWKMLPSTEKIKIIVRFTTLDGKMFEAEKLAELRLPAVLPRPGNPVGIQQPAPAETTPEKLNQPEKQPALPAAPMPKPSTPEKKDAPPPKTSEVPQMPKLPGIKNDLIPKDANLAPTDTVPKLQIPGSSEAETMPAPRTSPMPSKESLQSLKSPPPGTWVSTMKVIQPVSDEAPIPSIQLLKPVKR